MATAKQIQYRIGQAKKKLAKLNKEMTTTKGKIKKLEADMKKAKTAATKAKPKKKAAKKRPAKKASARKKR